jgi:catechol 2,3-dioxygenase-like lactoylglutathione lyase family enzyme
MLQGSLEGRLGADAVELVAGDGAAVLGAKVPDLAEIGGIDARGQLFNVFRIGCGAHHRGRGLRPPRGGARGRWGEGAAVEVAPGREAVVALVPFLLVADVERSIPFYEALGFEVIKRSEPNGRLEFAGLEATPSAKIMLARVAELPDTGPGAHTPGFLYLHTSDLERLRARLLEAGHEVDEIEDGPGPGPSRQMCVRDPDGHGHMVAELFEGSVGRYPTG